MAQDLREQLYRNLINSGKVTEKEIGSLDDFRGAISDEASSRQFYKNLIKNGAFGERELGTEDDFYGSISNDFGKPTQQPAEPVQKQTKPYNPSEDTMGAGVGGAISKALTEPLPETQSAQQTQAQAKSETKNTSTNRGYKPTEQEMMGFGMTIGNAQYAANNSTKGIDQMEKGAKNASPFGSGNVGLGNNQNLRKGNKTFDAEKGQFVDTYITSDGREFRDEQQANNAQEDLDAITNNVRYEETMKSLGIDTKSLESKDFNKMLGDAYMEREAILKKLKEDKEGERDVRDLIMSGGYDPTSNERIEQRNTYNAALRMLNRRIDALEAARDNGGFWSGTADVLTDSSNYSFGLTDLADSKEMDRLKEKIDKARESGLTPQLTDSEKALARNYMLNQQAEQLSKDNWWYNAGKGFGETLSFMKDFALTGGGFMSLAKGGMALGAKGGAKLASKVLGDYTTKNLGTKALGKTMEYIGKGVGLAAGAEAGGFMLNNTAQFASSAADIINKQTGNLTIGKDGNLSFEGGKDLGMAMLQSQIQRTGENGSELVGLAFDAVPGILGKVIQRTTVGKALKKLTDNALWKKGEGLLNYLGVQSVWGEGMEEEYGMARTEILNRLTDGSFAPEGSGLFDMERQIDTWKTVGLTSMILRVPAMVVSGTQTANYYGNMYNLNTSDRNMRNTFGDDERYQSVKAMLDGADNQNIASVLNNLMSNAELSREEKESMFMYANDLIKLRGFNIGNVVAAANGLQEPPKVSGYNIRGLHVDEVDKDGNVLASHDYETSDDLKAGLYELQQRRVDVNLQSDISVMKARPNQQYREMLIQYCAQTGVEPSVFEEMLSKPSMERTEAEQQIVAPFADLLHETVYDNTMLHEEQSLQDGKDLAEVDSIDLEDNSVEGAKVNAEWVAAQGNRRQIFDNNEDLREEVELMESQGLSHQEIISRLEWARPEEVDGMIDYYNTKSKFEGYINRKAQKIDEEAANSRQRHTFKGTIDGVADLNNVHTISDGTNRYYLVSGNVTTDPATGRITGSTSGLIIGMDLDGSFVQLSEDDGYSVDPVAQSLDQFEEAERTRLQQQVTKVIDPNGTMTQQPTVEPSEQLKPTDLRDNVKPESAKLGESKKERWELSEKRAKNGEYFYQDATGNIDLVDIPQDVFDKIGYTKAPLRLTPSMLRHVQLQHGKETHISNDQEAIAFILDVMRNFDHVRLGNDGALIFSVENGRTTGKRAITILLSSENGDYYGIKTSGYESVDRLEKRPLLWEGSAVITPSTDAASATVTSRDAQQSGEQSGSASDQSNRLSDGKDTNNSDTSQVLNVKVDKNGVKLYEEGTPIDAAIDDMQRDGYDPNQFADLAINEAQAELDRMNEPKTRAELVNQNTRKKELQNIIDYYNNVKARWAEMNQPAESEEIVNVEPEAPNNPGNDVPLQEKKQENKSKAKTADEKRAERIKALKEQFGDDFDDDFTYAQTAEELASMYVGRNRTLSREDLAKELGYPLGVGTDEVWAETLLAKKGEGLSTWDVAHAAWQSDENPIVDNEGNKKFNDQEIHDALIRVFQNAKQKSDIMDYAVNAREEAARQKAEGRKRQEEEDAANQAPFVPFTEQELAQMKASLPFAESTDEEIPDSPIVQLEKAIAELQQQEGMPPISLIDTDRMREGDWIDLAAQYYGGEGFYSQEDIDEVRNHVLSNGVFYDPENGSITVYSDSQTAEQVIEKIQIIKEHKDDRVQEERRNDGSDTVPQRPETDSAAAQEPETPAAEGAESAEGKGNPQPIKSWTTKKGRKVELFAMPETVDEDGNRHVKIGRSIDGGEITTNTSNGIDISTDNIDYDATYAGNDEVEERDRKDGTRYIATEIIYLPDGRVLAKGTIAGDKFTFWLKSDPLSTQSPEQTSTQAQEDYLQPRDAEEEKIIADVLSQLQKEIGDAVNERNKARSELQKAQARESERATDLFGNDNALNQEGQLFDNSDMPIDNSAEGVDRRTAAEREKLQEATNKLNRLQSVEERNSRIRGALDDYRRQTSIDYYEKEKPSATDKTMNTVGNRNDSRSDTALPRTEGISDSKDSKKSDTKQENKHKKEKISTSNPIEAIEQAAQSFTEEQEEKKAYGADNKLVSKDRYEELKKRMRDKLLGQMNLGVDPEILAIGTEMAVYHIEAGARKFIDYATNMINDLGDAIRPYLKAFYEGARRLPEMSELSKEMDSVSDVDAFDVLNYDKQSDNTVNEHKEKNNEAENVVSSQQNTEETVERKAEDADKYRAFSQAVANDMLNAMETGEKPYKSINDIRKKAKQIGLDVDDEGRTDILLQELVEDGLVSAARQYVNTYVMQQVLAGKSAQEVRSSRDLFNDIVKLYELQPSITQRSSNRIKMGQFSTPLPMSFVADVFATPSVGDVLEPTAGNGMMVFAVPESMVHANELDNTRLENLKAQKFKKVTNQDATQPFEGDEQYDAIIANPPFGSAPAKDYDGKSISGLAEQIALNALSKMKDDGKAAIIIGGNMEYADNGAIKKDKPFFTYLYDHYNVKGVVDMDGKLFSKQGTTYPTRMILIDGRRSEEEMAQTKVYPPVKSLAPKKATTFDELYDIVEKINNFKYKTNGNEVLRSAPRELESHSVQKTGQTDKGRDNKQSRTDANQRDERERSGRQPKDVGGQTERGRQTVLGGSRQTVGDSSLQRENRPSDGVSGQRGGTETDRTVGSQPGRTGGSSSNSTNGVVGGTHSGELARRDLVEEKRELSSDKLPYRPHNGAFSLESVAPAAMVEAMDNTLKQIEKEYGNIDDFVTKELGYDSAEEMHNALAAEQVDSVAMAIWNMKKGEGMIIGDQTGVGKGRQMAALIRWAVKQGKKPVFVTKDADLFSDIYRDLVDIGSGELRPFIFNSGVTITDANGVVVHKSLSDATQKKILAMNELPEGFDFAILSYPQMNTGDRISQEESGKAAKDKGERGAKKGKAVKAGKPTPKADFLRRIAKDNYLLMDESQNAAGSGNTGAYFQSILKDAKAVTFASATFAKRPDTMPLYAIRTAISKAKVKTWELLQMIGKGGVTLQEIMSRAMTQAGQMVRRERDMSDVKTDWKTISDKATAEKARRNYDNVMRAFNAIIDFQDNYIKPALAAKSIEFADIASSVSGRRGTEKAGVDNPPFVNRLYNFSKQLLLSLKVDAVVDEVVTEIESGRHPVIALENTLESALDEYGVGDVIDDPTLFGKLKKGLDATFRYTLKDEDGNEMGGELQPHELGGEGEKAYYDLVDLIKESTQGMFISPLDAITEKLENKGYKVGEISGRKTRAVLNDKGQYVVRKRENTDRKKLARDFNSGAVDVLIINKTGSTGISLHASNRFSDQRQRTMIMAQPLSDINDYMQMIGRIDRTGQVHRGYYINLGLPVPAETRFMMMLANKLKSLNANTTTSQENKDNDVDAPDLLNKYGDQVMIEYLRDNPDVYRKLGEFLKDRSDRGAGTISAARLDEYQPKEGDARQITGRVALLSVDEQDAFYDDVTRRYNELIKYLNDTGSNDLKISVLPLNARTIDREVSSEGTAPNSGNPFADNAYVEWVDMDILKKPMKASDVGKTIEQLNPEVEAPKVRAKTAAQEKALNGKLTPRVRQIISIVEKETQEKLDKENARYEVAKAKAEEDIAAKAETINRQQKRTTEQKKEAISKYAAERRQNVEESHNNMVNKIDANNMRLEKYLNMFKVGDSVLVPDDLTTDTFLGSSNGIFCGFKTKDEGITPSTTLAVFATLDGRRKIEVKLSEWNALTRINNMTEQNWDAAHEVTLSNWDEKIPSSSRKHGYIMTGNILQAISDTNFQGHLVTFTDDKGNVRDGVLMPDKWEPSQLKGSTVPISARKERIINLPNKESVTSTDNRVTITRYWGFYTLEVPKSKKQGGEFYLDKTLLDLVDGNDFFSTSSKMRARVDKGNIEAVLDRLGEMSVTLPSDRKIEFNEEGDSPKRMITTSDPMEAIEQAAESWRQTNRSPANNSKLQEISDMVNSLANREDLKGGAPTYIINSRQDLEALEGKVSRRVYREIERLYSDPDNGAAYIPRAGIVVVFGEHLEDAKEAEAAWWHEQTHGFWQKTPEDVRRKYGEACFEWLRKNRPDIYNHITKPGNYPRYDWLNEACAYFMGDAVIQNLRTDAFLNSKITGNNAEIINFATELRNYIQNGKGATNNQLRRSGEGEQASTAKVHRSNQQGRERGDNLIRPETESELQEVTDPIEAIELSAKSWKKQRKDRESDINDMKDYSAKGVYEQRINSIAYVTTESYQDAMAGLKVSQNAIAKDKDIPDSQNAYMAENLMHGKNGTGQQVFDATIRDRILDTVKKMMAIAGMRMGDIDRYCFAKHGLERNRELFVRDWLKSERRKSIKSYEDLNQDEQEIFHDLEEKLHDQFDDGVIETEEELNKKLEKALQQAHDEYIDSVEDGYVKLKDRRFADLKDRKITLSQYLHEIDKYIQQNIDGEYVASEHDYSGFRSMYGDENGEYNEDEIIAEVMTDEGIFGNDLTDEFWEGVNEASRYGLERYREAGMRSDEQIDKVEQMFHFYVPMRGFKEDRGEDMYQYFTGNSKEVSHIGGLLKHAKGRKSEASYPLATLFALTYKAISDCNQNLVNQKFYRLCQANPNDLVVLSDSWAELDENTGEWEEVYPPIPEDAGEEEIRQVMMAFEEEMRQKELDGKAKKLKGKPKFDYKPADKKKRDEHIVEVYMNGQKRLMTIVGNPRAAQALNGFTRFHIGDNWLSHANAAAKNWMSKVSTSYNPTFAARNMLRDWTHFAMILITREGSGYAKAAQGYYHPMRMKRLFDKFKAGTLDMNNEEERDFKDFMDNGGITGYVRMNKVKDMQDDVESIIKKAQQTGVIKNANKLWDSVLGAVEAWNEAIENSARFATFRASRHYAGRTKARSAYDAKEVTVNFNRKGAGSNTAGFKSTDKKVERSAKLSGYSAQLLGEGRMFFNATLQAVATIFKNFKNPDGSWNTKYIKRFAGAYASVPFVGGMLIPAINMALMNLFGGDGDDDPYANLPEWVRRKNICIWLGWIPGMEEKLAGTEHSDFFKDSFLTIPVGQEIAAFYSLGDLAASLTFYPELKPVDLSLEKEFWGFLNVFSPIDLDTKVTNGGLYSSDFVPEALGRVSTVLAPAIAVQQNLSWTGRKIYREDKYKGDETIPEYQMVYNNTNNGYIWVSKGLNYLGGGDDIERGGKILGIIPSQVNPGAMQYLVEQYSGGPGKFASNTSSAVRDFYEMAFGDKGEANFNVRKVEILKAFIQQADDNTKFYRAKAKYRRYKEEAEERSAQLSRAQKDAKENPEHYMKAEELSKGVEAARMYFIKENDKTLKAINKDIYSSTGQKRKDLQALYNQKLSEMVDSLDNMKPVEEMYRRERK